MLKDTSKTLYWFLDEERVGIVEKNTDEDSTGKLINGLATESSQTHTTFKFDQEGMVPYDNSQRTGR